MEGTKVWAGDQKLGKKGFGGKKGVRLETKFWLRGNLVGNLFERF